MTTRNEMEPQTAGRSTLTVVIPNYNGIKFLERCLSSVVTQDWPPQKIVVIDDGSTDGSQAFLRELQKRWPDIRLVLNEDNQGVLARVNAALAEITTDWVHFLAVDDTPLPGFYHLALKHAQRHPQAAVLFGAFVTSEEQTAERFTETADKWIEPGYISGHRMVWRLFHKAPALFSLGYTNIWRTQALKEYGGFTPELGAYSDTVAFRCLTARHGGIYLGGSPVVCVRVTDQSYGGQVWNDRERYMKTMELAAKIMAEHFPDLFPPRYIRNWKAKVVCEVGLKPWPKLRRSKHAVSWGLYRLWQLGSRLLGR
jgi:hypothetical protein